MKTKRKYFYLDDFEHRLLVGCLMTARNEYIYEDKPIEDVNELILRTSHRDMGATALAASEKAPQNSLRRAADKRKAERLPCRSKWAGGEYVLSVGKSNLTISILSFSFTACADVFCTNQFKQLLYCIRDAQFRVTEFFCYINVSDPAPILRKTVYCPKIQML